MNTNNSVLCVIPARYASTRLEGKPLLEINGKPLVMWSYEQALCSQAFEKVCIATDHGRIYEVAKSWGADVVMTRTDHPSGTDRVYEVVEKTDLKYVVNLQGDEPQIPHELLRMISKNVQSLDDNSLLTCISNATIEEAMNPNVVKAVLQKDMNALYFSRAMIPYNRDGTGNMFLKHHGIYGFSRGSIARFCSLPPGKLERIEKLEQLRALEGGMRIRCIRYDFNSIGIDTPEDLESFRRQVG
ncbi:MAG: 3-deoxy-manno-octulosonate cytidylyltransferase [Fibrobacterota bacterium]